jgi:hypothetical protein
MCADSYTDMCGLPLTDTHANNFGHVIMWRIGRSVVGAGGGGSLVAAVLYGFENFESRN